MQVPNSKALQVGMLDGVEIWWYKLQVNAWQLLKYIKKYLTIHNALKDVFWNFINTQLLVIYTLQRATVNGSYKAWHI